MNAQSLMNRVGDAYIASSAVVVGDVTLGADSSVWPCTVIRGDVAPVRIGARVNVQDGSVLHCVQDVPLEIADDVLIAHGTVIHCRSIGSFTLIGDGAILLDYSCIGEDCLIGAGSLVPPRMVIPPGSLVMGSPARIVSPIRDKDRTYIRRGIALYQDLARRYVDGEIEPYRQTP